MSKCLEHSKKLKPCTWAFICSNLESVWTVKCLRHSLLKQSGFFIFSCKRGHRANVEQNVRTMGWHLIAHPVPVLPSIHAWVAHQQLDFFCSFFHSKIMLSTNILVKAEKKIINFYMPSRLSWNSLTESAAQNLIRSCPSPKDTRTHIKSQLEDKYWLNLCWLTTFSSFRTPTTAK